MKNNLLDLRDNIDTILEVRDQLLDDLECLKYRDVDTETTGYWVKIPVIVNGEHKTAALGIYVIPGKGITVNYNSMEYYKNLPGRPSYDEVMDTIYEGWRELGYVLDL